LLDGVGFHDQWNQEGARHRRRRCPKHTFGVKANCRCGQQPPPDQGDAHAMSGEGSAEPHTAPGEIDESMGCSRVQNHEDGFPRKIDRLRLRADGHFRGVHMVQHVGCWILLALGHELGLYGR